MTLPESIGQLAELQELNVSYTALTTVPESLGQLAQLQKLEVQCNQLTALPECVGELTQLKELSVHNNQLSTLPESLGRLPQLQDLDVGWNQLTRLPELIGHFTKLQKLRADRNKLAVLPESIGQLVQLKVLSLWWNQLETLPESVGRLRQLQTLSVDNNQLTTLPESVGQLTLLKELSVSSNQLTTLPVSVGQLWQLQRLEVQGNQLTTLPEWVGQLTQLQELSVGNNRLSTLAESLGQLAQLQELNVSNNQLTTLPESLGQLRQLKNLSVWWNELTTLPESLGQLRQLQTLSVSSNQLTTLPEWVGQLTQLQRLEGQDNQLTTLPESLGRLTHLQELYVGRNQLSVLPEPLGQLRQLRRLEVQDNQLTTLPEWVGQLRQLQELDLQGNQLITLPESVGLLTGVERLVLSRNRLTVLPESLRQLVCLKRLALDDNPALNLPPEVSGLESPTNILSYYFNSRRARPLNEAKVILVGRGGAGKTSLVRRLINNLFDPHEKKTDGIAIIPWKIQLDQDEVRLNVWDFGGQEIMHATHQFFFTKRSLYILVLNAREGEQEANIEYWLRLIESFSGESPVIVVINKIRAYAFDLNRRGLQGKYPTIREFVQTDCEDGTGIDDLLRAIKRETDRLEHLRDRFPASWFVVKDRLANLPTNYIDYDDYRQLCEGNGIRDTQGQDTLIGFLHDLGLVINFRDDSRLADTHVLSPHWVTTGIYRILNSELLAKNGGELVISELRTILDERDYPRRMHQFLLDLMRKFELCYEFYEGNGKYLIPELLGKDEPDLAPYSIGEPLRFEYHYAILPEGLLPRLLVRTRSVNQGLPRWRTGAVMEFEGNRAIVKSDVQGRKVSVSVYGDISGRRRLLAVIRSEMEKIHSSVARLQVQERVPIPGNPDVWEEYETLVVLETDGQTEYRKVAAGKIIKVSIPELLNGVEEAATRRISTRDKERVSKPIAIFFSYSHKDEALRDQLETHLTLMQRNGEITTWHDRKITAGEEWKGKIDDRLRNADIVLILVSSDFIASNYCWDIEMKLALERHEKGEARVVPIIVRDCQWHKAPFGRLEPLPKNGTAVKESQSLDRAWRTVADGIEEVAKEMRIVG